MNAPLNSLDILSYQRRFYIHVRIPMRYFGQCERNLMKNTALPMECSMLPRYSEVMNC